MSLLTQAGHQVQTSVASLLERQWRLNAWTTKYILGCGECACDICSVPEPDYTYTLQYDADGHVTDTTLDLSCVLPSEKAPLVGCRVIYIDNVVRDCELTGCQGVSVSEQKYVYLTHCEPETTEGAVRIYLKNNGVAVTEDQFGNPVPEYYLIGEGQLKYLCIVNGRIVRIVN
jgi:hypothetical protein